MKFFALAFLGAASANPFAPVTPRSSDKAAMMSKLMKGATPTANSQLRKLDEEYIPDISRYYMKFEQCQFVKAYDDELAENEESTTVLATKRFVIFRLCPSSDCSSNCNYNYGEYLIDLETYLEATVEYAQEQQENMCQNCEDYCGNNNRRQLQNNYYDIDCYSCTEECEKIENMEDNGYIDATEFLECQMIYDPEDDNRNGLYAGPICSSNGQKIKIGVFTDEDCLFVDNTKEVEDYLMNDNNNGNMMLSHALLKMTYTDTCISCVQVDEDNNNNNGDDNNNNNNNQEDPEILEMCEQLYEQAAKCEKTHGFDDGFSNYWGYENQLANEEVVCDFMQSLKSGTYDEEGEIIVSGASSISGGGASTTGGQKFALTFFILGTVGLAVYAAMLHSKLVKGGKSDLSSSGGAMA
jgi:hypothetical protein